MVLLRNPRNTLQKDVMVKVLFHFRVWKGSSIGESGNSNYSNFKVMEVNAIV